LKRPTKGNGVDPAKNAGGTEARSERHAVVQRTLERYPWAKLSPESGDQFELRLLLDAAGEEGRRWFVRTADGDRLPGPLDVDVYIALGQLYNDQIRLEKRGQERTVYTSLGELVSLMGRSRGGMTYQLVSQALLRLAAVRITAVQTWKEGDTRGTIEDFSLLSNVKFGLRRDGDESKTAVRIRFSEELAQSIAEGQFRLLDVGRYFALETPTAKRLFRYLDVRRWRGHERLSELAFPIRQLADELPIDRTSPSHIKRTLEPAHEQLVASGYLAAAQFEERYQQGKKRPTWWATYRFADASALPVEPRQDRASDLSKPDIGNGPGPDYIRDTVGDILEVLRDEHSIAFYAKCAKLLPEAMLRNILGGVKQMRDEGATLELARKTFTATAKKRAQAIGITL